jgi:DNA primase
MAYISNEIINEIRNKTDIVEVVSRYVNLTKTGKNYIGVCPFHDDHSPSMSVSPEKQIYTCFSCGASGNVFTFVSDFEKISFSEAVKLLGEKVGINVSNDIILREMNILIYMIWLVSFIKIVLIVVWVRMP